MRSQFLFLLLLLAFLEVQSQCESNSFHTLDINKVEARFNNASEHFWDRIGTIAYFVPKASRVGPVFANGLWIGGLSPSGQLHLAASTYRQNGPDFYAGPVRNPTAYTCEGDVQLSAPMMRNGLKRLSNGKILMIDSVEIAIYDPITEQTLFRMLPQPRSWLDAVELTDGRIMFFGDNTYPIKNAVLFMDTVGYNLTVGPTLNWFHKNSSSNQLLNGKVLLAGVIGCELFDPVTGTSTIVPDMLYPRMKHAAVRLPNGNVHVFGGGSSIGGTGLTLRTQYFDDSLGYWFPGPDLAVGRNSPTVVELPNGNYLIVGGSSNSTQCELFDPVANTISPSHSLDIASNIQNAVLVNGGKLVVCQRDNGPLTGTVRLFDINSGQEEPIRIEGCGPQVVMVDSSFLALGSEGSVRLRKIHWKTGRQPASRWQYNWKLDRTEIDAFRADFLANDIDFSRYPDIETWPAHGATGDGEDRNLAPFVDVNLDGLYRPADDGDYPCIVGDQAIWWVYNDQGPHLESFGLPMNLQIEAMAYAFDCNQTACPDTSLDYATFVHYEITNHSDTTWSNVYIGSHYDLDMGGYFDDFVGCDSALSLAIGYNGDNDDTDYGNGPPAWGAAILPNGQVSAMSGFLSFGNTFGSFNSNPTVPGHYYNYLRSEWLDSTHLVNNGGNGHSGSATGPSTNFMYPSTQGFCGGFLTGWSELTAGSIPYDRRFVQSAGPFTLQPGQSIQYDIFYPFARDSTYTESVCALKDATAVVRDWWQNQLDRACFSIVVATDPLKASATFAVIPNPVTGEEFIADFGIPLEISAVLELLDLNGKLVRSIQVPAGVDQQKIGVGDLPSGFYLARLNIGSNRRVARVLIW